LKDDMGREKGVLGAKTIIKNSWRRRADGVWSFPNIVERDRDKTGTRGRGPRTSKEGAEKPYMRQDSAGLTEKLALIKPKGGENKKKCAF